jgi:hypothetical protein
MLALRKLSSVTERSFLLYVLGSTYKRRLKQACLLLMRRTCNL